MGHSAISEALAGVAGVRTPVNAYLTGAGVETSLAAHSDTQCTFIIQLNGAKRWRLWHKRTLLPHSDMRVVGKKPETQLDIGRLGPPYIDVDLRQGQARNQHPLLLFPSPLETQPGVRVQTLAGQASDLRRAGADQVLYIPRGTIHHTSTVLRSDEVAGAGKASFHLTVGMEKYFKPVRTPKRRE